MILVKFTVVLLCKIGYNIINLRCTITLVSFEPTFTLNGIPILLIGCQALTHIEDWKGRQKVGCGYPPSIARSQKTRRGILGNNTKERAVHKDCSL